MFSLASAAGTPGQAHAQTQVKAATDKKRAAPVSNSLDAAERLLRSAVEAIQFTEAEQALERWDLSVEEPGQPTDEDAGPAPQEQPLGSQFDVTG
jgi:hypothetical protein